jgi:GMP synthase-like glutamine amidotransferase
MKILIYDCHKSRVQESEKIKKALLRGHPDLEIDIAEVRKFQFPDIGNYDAFIVSGADGHSEKHAWPRLIKEQIAKIIGIGKPVLGVCFGSQILAELYGFEIITLKKPEIGWVQVNLTDLGKEDQLFKELPTSFPIYQYHIRAVKGEGKVLAESRNCIQAVKYSDTIYGIQFHAEESPESGKEYLKTDRKCENYDEASALAPEEYIEWKIYRNFIDIITKTVK